MTKILKILQENTIENFKSVTSITKNSYVEEQFNLILKQELVFYNLISASLFWLLSYMIFKKFKMTKNKYLKTERRKVKLTIGVKQNPNKLKSYSSFINDEQWNNFIAKEYD